MVITAQEFEEQYAEKSGIELEQLHEWGQFVFPCWCNEAGCRGWQMRNPKTFNNYEIDMMPNEYRIKAIKYLLESYR